MNIANKLTILRIILIPFMIFFMLTGSEMIALGIFVAASATDFLDGYLARRLNIVTNFGKFMDPVADKLLVISAMMVFVELGRLSSVVVIIIFSRELVIGIFRAIAASEGIVIAAGNLGKIKTTVQFIMVMLLFTKNWPFGEFDILKIFVYMAVIFTVLSGAEYILKNQEVLRH